MNYFVLYPHLSCACGAALMLGAAYAASIDRKAIDWVQSLKIMAVYLAVALVMLKTTAGAWMLKGLTALAHGLGSATHEGAGFVFGRLSEPIEPWGLVFAFQVLPITIFFSGLVGLLSYLGVIEKIVNGVTRCVRPLLGTSSGETAGAIAKSFLGAVEAPLLIQGFLPGMTTSELFCVMVSCMSMIAASLFAVYMQLGVPGHHLIAANIISIFVAILFAKIMYPSRAKSVYKVTEKAAEMKKRPGNAIEAIIQGTMDGLQLALAIAAMLITFLALIAAVNLISAFFSHKLCLPTITVQELCGYLFAPLGYLFGFDTAQALVLSKLIGLNLVTNEMVAYIELTRSVLSERAVILATYALCGFANISIIGIVVGGISTLAPSRRAELSSLAVRALLAATLGNLFSAYVIGIFY